MRRSFLFLFLGLSISACSFSTDSMFEMGSLWPDDDELAQSDGELLPAPAGRPADNANGGMLGGPITPGDRGAPVSFERGAPVESPGRQGSAPVEPRSAPVPTGTSTGQRVAVLHSQMLEVSADIAARSAELAAVLGIVTQSALGYHAETGSIRASLQLGTPRGNPDLVGQWNAAQADLDRLSDALNALAALADRVAADSSSANSILQAVWVAYDLSGAVDEDHRQLALLEDDARDAIVRIDRLLTEISGRIARQVPHVVNERTTLASLAEAIRNGSMDAGSAAAALARVTIAGRDPLIVIRFDGTDVVWQDSLGLAVNRAVDQFPTVKFDIVGVSTDAGNATQVQLAQANTREDAQDVFRSLLGLGVPTERISLRSITERGISVNEVRLYVQ